MNVDIILEEINEAVLIPEKSVLTAKDFSYVFIVEKDIAKLKKKLIKESAVMVKLKY